ncbi:short chain dehydrogenase [Candidatus Protochlamydia naegleriophila]|uniref:Short chain dehydrogenase n=1 Tax=Candidatus Protochlamydia naegleriophila TaxID=389348 RepID=A0A0U5EQ52_9BACT|nr:SDR family NAD(P)-dependent oxidoreductase [Candidatus Protochlamydia naegleriophila]CUI16113.1 short chain dehydrogenase [Candidatus Protochlamydia naegleriophila]
MGQATSNQCLTGKVAIVTGAARGIGRSAAIALAHAGAAIVGLDCCSNLFPNSGVKPSAPEDLNETGRLVQATGQPWLGQIVDQREFASLQSSAQQAAQRFGGIDILFANPGVQGFKPLLEMEDSDWQIHMDVNLTGTAKAIRAFAPYLVKQGGGRIIVTSSTQGKHGTKNGAAYSASKWGIIGLMKSAALELGVYGITVNALIPGLIDTELTRHEERYAQVLQAASKQPTGSDEETARQILASQSPLNLPWIDPDDVAPLVVFLASDAAHLISGATFDVTAGDSAHFR